MKNESNSPLTLPEPSEDEIRDYAYHLYQQANCMPGHDLDNWLEATACLKANIPAHRSGTRLHQHVNEPEIGELYAVSVAARTQNPHDLTPGFLENFCSIEIIQKQKNMLHNLKQIRGHKLAASDGAIGHVKDFYFDDKTWAIRYLVADTGNWLTGRQVLLSPYSFGRLDQDGKVLSINLTKKQIENSPSIDTDRPVSRQYEQNYYNYYGWPTYWEGDGLWGAGEYPTFAPSTRPYAFESYDYPRWDDIHLRSTNAVTGYGIQATDGALGSVSGFLVDQKKWVIRELTVETGHWYSGKEILITPAKIERISYEESKVFVKLTKGNLERTEEQHLATAGV